LLLLDRLALLLNPTILLLLKNRLALLLLLNAWLLLLKPRARLLLRSELVAILRCRRGIHVAIRGKRAVDGHGGWTAMIDVGKLRPIGAGRALILQLRAHGWSMGLTPRSQFRGSGSHLDAARSAVETHAGAARVVSALRAVVDVMHDGDVDVIEGAVVVEVAAAPVTALVAVTAVAETVIDAAVEADVQTPVAAVKAILVVPEAPVSWCPERALIRSLNPGARHPVVALRRIGPVAGRPEVAVPGS